MKKLFASLITAVGVYYVIKGVTTIADELLDEKSIERGVKGSGESMCSEDEFNDI